MAVAPMRVLLVEDDASYAGLLTAELQGTAVALHRVESLAVARGALRTYAFDAIVLDLNLPDSNGVDTVERMHEAAAGIPIVVLTSSSDQGLSVMSMQRGAQDYLLKSDADADVLLRSLRYACERASFRQSLRAGETRFRALVENSYDAITLLNEGGEVIYDSRSIVRVMGYTPEERLGHSITEYLHTDDVPGIAERFVYCLKHPDEILRVEYRFLHKDGTWRWGEAIGVNRLGDPAVQAVVVNHRDVTDRKVVETALRASEEQLRQAHKMEAVGRLAGGVAHDFNNVLTAIYGYTDLLLDQFPQGDPRRSDVVEIRRAAERAAALTRQLLAFSRKQIMQPRVVDLNEIILSIQTLLERLVGEEIRLDLRLDPTLVRVKADSGQIEQVLMNLAANARDAMPEGGELRIVTRNERITPITEGRPGLVTGTYAVVEVADTGTGMPAAVRDHIFEPFYTTKEPGKGTGLGLATVYGIVKQTGGGIFVESEEGQGTTFIVCLPRASEEEPTSSP
jgi:two-component system, cell cycle sensor histidine kinase and response regulator CckA